MLVSYNWLKTLVDLKDITPEEIAHKLTFAGVEVESVTRLASATNLVVGEVMKCELVPDTHLHQCYVDIDGEVLNIICGAPNVRKGLRVIVALPGAKLPGGEIKAATIHGLSSNGMLCSLLELGVDEKYVDEIDLKGIHELNDDIAIGEKNVLAKLGLDDTILNLKLLANRPDLLSVYRVAQEVGALFNREVKPLTFDDDKGSVIDFKVGSDTKKCPQFSARIIKGITVKESPLELKKYLIAMGVRPINNIVDISNYIMLLTGEPLHMYDFDKLPKPELIVKDKYQGDFVALDEKHYAIKNGDLVVTSNNEVMCLAGVMGGLSSSDNNHTKNIVIEAANFNAASVRRTSLRLNLISEASTRFAHGINPHQYTDVIKLATALIKKYCGASEISEIITYDTLKHHNEKIHTNAKMINSVLGTTFDLKTIIDTLARDHFKIENIKGASFDAYVPSYRLDIDGVNDLAEEVIRILGFSEVKSELPELKTEVGSLSDKQKQTLAIRKHLNSVGLYEVLTYTLVNKERAHDFQYLISDTPYKLLNPMTDDHAYVRKGLVPSLLDVVSYNLAHQNKDFGIFEISDINVANTKYTYLAIALTGNAKQQDELKKTPYTFYHLKGYLEAVMSMLGIEKSRYQLEEWNLNGNDMHPGRSACIYMMKNLVGYFGELHPNAYAKFGIKNNKVHVLEINLTALLNTQVGQVRFKAIPRFPVVTRDLALLVERETKVEYLTRLIKKNGGALIKDVKVFDVYVDASLKAKKSVAVTLTLAKDDATLKDEEINEAIEKIKTVLLKENINIR